MDVKTLSDDEAVRLIKCVGVLGGWKNRWMPECETAGCSKVPSAIIRSGRRDIGGLRSKSRSIWDPN